MLPFDDEHALTAWPDAHHADQPGLWVKLAKRGHGIASVNFESAQVAAAKADRRWDAT